MAADGSKLEMAGAQREMPERFSIWSLAALAFTLTSTWQGTASSIGAGLMAAGQGGMIWALTIAGLMTTVVAVGMAELASAYPVSGAQYYWSFMVARDDYKAFTSYITAWLTVIGWWFASAAVANFVSSTILDITVAWTPDFEPQSWQKYLIYVCLIWIAALVNIFLSNWIPRYNKMTFVLAITSLCSTCITLFVIPRNNHATATTIFTKIENRTGWSSDGFAFMLAVGNSVFAYLGGDCAAKMAEEVPNPSKTIPLVTLFPPIIGLITAFPFLTSLMYSVTDLDAVLTNTRGLPLFEIYRQGTQSHIGASVLLGIFAFFQFSTLIACATTTSRTVWAVARDGVLPYSQYWDAIHPVAEVPVNAILLSASFISIYGLLFLGSSTAFSAMVSAAIIFVQTSIVLPQAVLLFRGRDQVLPPRYMNLGKFGVVVNALAVSWVVFLNVIYCFPTRMPVSGKNMNYVSIVCVGMMAFILLLWFTTKKKTFMGPTIDIKVLHARRVEGMQTELTIINAGHTSDSTIVDEESISEKKDKEELGIKISHTAINRRLS
ncbi:hypothetical protein V2G26_011081 [Clonostachys chloroleuca]